LEGEGIRMEELVDMDEIENGRFTLGEIADKIREHRK
jgi:hypothetical protein